MVIHNPKVGGSIPPPLPRISDFRQDLKRSERHL